MNIVVVVVVVVVVKTILCASNKHSIKHRSPKL